MSLTISPLFGNQIPAEIKNKYFSHLSLSELCKSGQVCSDWFKLTHHEDLWIPFSNTLELSKPAQGSTIKTTVLTDLKKHQSLVNKIIYMIDNDKQLAEIVDISIASLDKFKKMPSIDCTLYFMGSLRKDCTALLVYLPTKFVRALGNHLQQSEIIDEEQIQLAAINFHETEKYLSFLGDLIKAPLGPYNAVKTMTATLNLIKFNLTCEKVAYICASIVKSHPDLSELFKSTFDSGNQFIGPIPIPMTTVIERTIIPQMDELGLDVTIDDWISCGYLK